MLFPILKYAEPFALFNTPTRASIGLSSSNFLPSNLIPLLINFISLIRITFFEIIFLFLVNRNYPLWRSLKKIFYIICQSLDMRLLIYQKNCLCCKIFIFSFHPYKSVLTNNDLCACHVFYQLYHAARSAYNSRNL